jgi:hypothetical protein
MSTELESLKAAITGAQTKLRQRMSEAAAVRRRLAGLTKRVDDPKRAASLLKEQEQLVAEFEHRGLPELGRALKEYLTSLSGVGRGEFETEFPRLCHDAGLPVTGNLDSGYRIHGAIEVRATFSKSQARVSTVSETRIVSPPAAKGVVDAVHAIHKRLFQRPFDAVTFARTLVEAFLKVGREGESVPLADVHKQIFLLRQKPEFFRDNSVKRLITYPLDEFSIDLGRFLESRTPERSASRQIMLELGRDGIVVFKDDGSFESYKFLKVE